MTRIKRKGLGIERIRNDKICWEIRAQQNKFLWMASYASVHQEPTESIDVIRWNVIFYAPRQEVGKGI